MSWQDSIKQPFVIITGDGKRYVPLWDASRCVSKVVEYNYSVFEFKELSGTLVKRNKPRGAIYDIEVVFQGKDHLEQRAAFDKSTVDSNPWRINHPYYGVIICQPIGLKYDNTDGNITRISGRVIETIGGLVGAKVDYIDKIVTDSNIVNDFLAATYIANLPIPETADVNSMLVNALILKDKVLAKINNLSDNYNTFINNYNAANTAINGAIRDVNGAITSLKDVIATPAYFVDSVINRVGMLVDSFDEITANINSIIPDAITIYTDLAASIKRLFENNAGTTVSSICVATMVNVTNDYTTRPAVIQVMDTLINTYNEYILTLDNLQNDNGASVNSYIPDPDSLTALSALVSYTVNTLLVISANAKQQRIITLPEDSNIINLAYQYYGLKEDDSTIEQVINDNNIGRMSTDIYLMRKGSNFIYYV